MAPVWEDDFELDCEDDEGSVVLVVDPLPLVPPGSMVELTTAKSKSKPEPPFGPGPPPRLVIVIVCSVSSKPVARYTVCQRVFVGLSYCIARQTLSGLETYSSSWADTTERCRYISAAVRHQERRCNFRDRC